MDQAFDYVVIGGGAAGCPLAATLAKKGRTLLLERGPPTVKNPLIRTCCNKDEVTWHRTEGGSWTATANVLGGGSSINAGVFIQESLQSPFFTQAHPFLDSQKVQAAYSQVATAMSHQRTRETWIGRDLASAMVDVGLGKHAINTDTAHYGIYHPHSLFNADGKRHSAADLLPTEGSEAANLVVKTNILVCRLIFDLKNLTPRAIGFEYRDNNETNPTLKTFQQPNTHIILSCGAIHTPRLLLLSGIGNADDLRKHDIPIVLDQPHVGRHLKDKPVIAVSVSSALPVAETVLDTMAATADFNIGTATGGTLATYIGPSLLATIPKSYRTPSAQYWAARVLHLLPAPIREIVDQQITIYVTLSNPQSEGSVAISSADGGEPIITTAGYQTREEVQAAAKGLQVVSRLIRSSSLSPYVRSVTGLSRSVFNKIQRLMPISLFSSSAQSCKPKDAGFPSPLTFPVLPEIDGTVEDAPALKSWLNEMHAEGWTYTGTCRFDDVVNRDFSVKGIDKLSIVDASVLKRPTRVNGQATMMMIGTYAGHILTAKG